MAVVGMKQLLEAGVHFGHQTRRWNPKMKPYIYTERNGIHIIDLSQTVGLLEQAYSFVEDLTRQGGKILFVGTKRQAQESVAEEATRAGQFFVNQRWLGGLLTNFQTIQQRLRRLEELEQLRDTGGLAALPKKEQLKLMDQQARLSKLLGGIRGMRKLPDALFIVDTRKEHIAIHEAQRLEIPIVALLDTNSDPDEVTYPIPANDDAIRAVRLLSGKIAEAAHEGTQEYLSTVAKEEAEEGLEGGTYESYTFEPEGYEASLEPGTTAATEAEVDISETEAQQPEASVIEEGPDTERTSAVSLSDDRELPADDDTLDPLGKSALEADPETAEQEVLADTAEDASTAPTPPGVDPSDGDSHPRHDEPERPNIPETETN